MAKRLAATIGTLEEKPDLVLIGREFGDYDDGIVAPCLAASLGWSFFGLTQHARWSEQGLGLYRERRNVEEWLVVGRPVVASVTNDRRSRLRHLMMKNVMEAKRMAIPIITIPEGPAGGITLTAVEHAPPRAREVACRILRWADRGSGRGARGVYSTMEAPLMSNFIVALSPANLKDAVDWLSPIVEANRIARLQGASVRTVILSQSDSAQLAALAAGAEDVWVIRQPGLDEFADVDQLAHVFAVALEEPALADFRLALLPAGAIGEGISAALASRLRATALGTCTELTLTADGVSAQRRAFGGRARITIELHGACIATIRRVENKQPTSAAIPEDGSVHGIELVGDIPLASPISRKDGGASVRSVAGAKVVVSGGRGMGGDDGFKLLADIAECRWGRGRQSALGRCRMDPCRVAGRPIRETS